MAEEERNRDSGEVDEPHDVLAADEFGIGSRSSPYSDPHTGEREPHDVLAADEFAMPTREARAPDPHSDEREAHDVLAADEFAMPGAGAPHTDSSRGPGPRTLLLPLLALVLALIVLRRRT